MDIGIAEATIFQLYTEGLIRYVGDLYSLQYQQFISLDRLQKNRFKIFTKFRKSKHIPYHRVLYALGIR